MTINGLEGSIFSIDYEDADGLIIFIPCGLTAIRVDFKRFLSSDDGMEEERDGVRVYSRRESRQTVIAFENPRNIIQTRSEAKHIVETAMEMAARRSIKRIAMNGIRFAAENQSSWQERELVKWVLDWCHETQNEIECITFVDLRGGFDFLRKTRETGLLAMRTNGERD